MKFLKQEIVFITDFDLEKPSDPGYNRVLCYAKALLKAGISSSIFSCRFDYSTVIEKEISSGIIVYYSSARINYKSTFEDFHFVRNIRFFMMLQSIFIIRNSKETQTSFLLYNSSLASTVCSLLYFSLLRSHMIFIEKNELKLAIVLNRPLSSNSLFKNIKLLIVKLILIPPAIITDFLAVFFKGVIVISNRFYRLYKPFIKRIIKIPILANVHTISVSDYPIIVNQKPFKIGYFGLINENKDGLFTLIKSVLAISSTEVELHIFGKGNIDDLGRLKSIVNNNHSIYYKGVIESAEVPGKLKGFDLLAFPRPNNLQTRYGFSTKLAEYLLSGVPVLTTDVSDTCVYLSDNESAFILNSNKITTEILSAKIETIMKIDKRVLLVVGTNGSKVAQEFFNPLSYSNDLQSFFFD